MPKKVYDVQVTVYPRSILRFYNDNPSLGTIKNPYPADAFFDVKCPAATFWGPMKNVLLIDSDCTYEWSVTSGDDIPISLVDDEDTFLEFAMVSPGASDQKWKKVFSDAPQMGSDKKIKVGPVNKNSEKFQLNSAVTVDPTVRLKYSILFKFTAPDNTIKYGLIDPQSMTMPPPIEP